MEKKSIPLLFLLIFAFVFQFHAEAQTLQNRQQKTISIEMKTQRLSVILKKIEALSSFKFVFNYEDVDRYMLSVSAKDEPVSVVLERLFRHRPFTYEIKGEIVTVRLKREAPSGSRTVSGVVTTVEGRKTEVLPYAYVACPTTGMATQTDANGKYELKNLPKGTVQLTVRYVGKETQNKTVELTSDMEVNFRLTDDNFMTKEVVVTARPSQNAITTNSVISRKAVEHLQANSLQDVLSLLPGGVVGERNLNNSSQITLRSATGASESQDVNMNALGTSVVTDGAPLSNNANLQAFNPAVSGVSSALGGGASPAGGVDIRSVQMDNVESIEVIRGIPSVEYGDVASGVVLIRTKAGVSPLQMVAKANRNVYEFSAGKGLDLGKDNGALNMSVNYAHNVDEPHTSYKYYERVAAKALYSNVFWKNKWRTNTSLDLIYGMDRSKQNPDDEAYLRASKGKSVGLRLNTNGQLYLNKGFLKNFRYVLSADYTAKDSYSQQNYSSANAPYSMTTTDGTVLANGAGKRIYDTDGNEITHFGNADASNYAVYLPSTYFGKYTIEGRELNLFGKGVFTLFQKIGQTTHRILLGADAKLDKNYGKGKKFDPTTPPYRNLSMANASFRPRKYSDIPGLKQLGLFAEENFSLSLGEWRMRMQAGLRYDDVSVVKNALSFRVNGSIDILPHVLSLEGGYGVTAKAPTLLYLYPETAYFEYINVNELADESIAEDQRVFMTTTRALNTQNKELEMAKNKRAELGFKLHLGQTRLLVTAFRDRMNNGYAMEDAYSPFIYNTYVREGEAFRLNTSVPLLSVYKKPGNTRTINTKGVEFDLDLGRFDAIRTAFSVNGAWVVTKSYNNDYDIYDPNGNSTVNRTHVALYEKGLYKHNYERMSTAVRVTHNIPELGFVVTLTGQTIWKEADWYNIGDTSMPVKYISKYDGQIYDIDPVKVLDPNSEFNLLRMSPNDDLHIKESYSPLFCFNINVTKHIGKYARLSFFSNNMFRSYPEAESKRSPGTYVKRNSGLFSFGVELGLNFN